MTADTDFCPRLLAMTRIMIEFTRDHPTMPTQEARERIKKIIAREIYGVPT